MRRPSAGTIVGIVLALFALIQLVPYGRNHANPAVAREPSWNSPETRALAVEACYDCHSNETKWPWYSHVAPVSWRLQFDVDEGRRHLNFSRFDQQQRHADEAAREVRRNKMPPQDYLWGHPEAKLDSAEKRVLIQGLVATFGDDTTHRRRRR
jgi:mono/diheme cytochrome c family protein